MQKPIRAILETLSVYLLVGTLAFGGSIGLHQSGTKLPSITFLSVAEAAETEAIPAGWESYLGRPDILKVEPQNQNLGESWENLKAAHFSFIAELLEMYPKETQLYFLARDSEHLYDVARLVTKGTSDESRVHLLNISRANMRDPNLKGYLEENGISEASLSSGKQVLFVDTGFSGTIPRVIGENFAEDLRNHLKTHLIVSSNPAHPSSRAFLVHINPMANQSRPSSMHGSVVSYEHMARYTDRSSRIIFHNGHFHPISPLNSASDGSVSKPKSLQFMSDLSYEWQRPGVREMFNRERESLRTVKAALLNADVQATTENLKARLTDLGTTAPGRLLEAQIRDAFELSLNYSFAPLVTLDQLGLVSVDPKSSGSWGHQAPVSKKNELIKKYPDWAPILENPDDMIPKLFAAQNWQMIGNLFDAKVDDEINKLLVNGLYNAPATGFKKDFQIQMIENGGPEVWYELAHHTLTGPQSEHMHDLIKLLIEKGDTQTLYFLSGVFAQPQTQQMTDLIKLLIEKGNKRMLVLLAIHTFSKPHAGGMTGLIELLMDKGDSEVLDNIARFVIPNPALKNKEELIKRLIEKDADGTSAYLSEYVFSLPENFHMTDLMKLMIDRIAEGTSVSLFVSKVLTNPNFSNRIDLIKYLVDKHNARMNMQLAYYIFSQPEAEGMRELLKKMVEKADAETALSLVASVFSKPGGERFLDLLTILIKRTDSATLVKMTMTLFSKGSPAQDRMDLLRIIVEQVEGENANELWHWLRSLANAKFDKPELAIFRDSVKVADRTARSNWIQDELVKIKSPLAHQKVASATAKAVSPALKPGAIVEVSGRSLEVVKLAGEGRRGVVFQVKSEKGARYALKVAKLLDDETLQSLAQESAKAKEWQRLGIPHSKVLIQQKTFVLKTWMDGLDGNEVIERYVAGDIEMKNAAAQAILLVKKIRDRGAYIGDFRPANLIWNGKAWVIIDSGSIQQGMTIYEAQSKWEAVDARGPKFHRRWKMQPAPLTCADIF
jgi:hypothetical protein